MNSFEFRTAPNIQVQTGGAARLAGFLGRATRTTKRVFLITDQILLELGVVDGALQSLKEAGFEVEICADVVPDPPEDMVLAVAKYAEEISADLVVGMGGGSTMDTAKIVAALLGSEQPLSEMYGVNQICGERVPLVLVPTTAGTGSEVTPVSIVTVGETRKMGVSSPVLYPDLALLDASLTVGLPKHVTAATGIDAMVHAIEAFTSRIKKNPMSDAAAELALRKLHGNIERSCIDGNDIEAREEMLIGAMLGGQAFANAPVAAVHALAYPLGSQFHIPHGHSNSLVLPAVLEFNAKAAEQEYAHLASLMGLQASSGALIDEMARIAESTEIETRLSQVGVPEDALRQLAKDAIEIDRLLVNNPREVTFEDALACYSAVY
jgi:alcohol dehydrogenase